MQIKSVLSKLTLLMLLSSYFTENRHRIKFDLPSSEPGLDIQLQPSPSDYSDKDNLTLN